MRPHYATQNLHNLKRGLFVSRNFHVLVLHVLVTLHLLGQNKGKSYFGSQSGGYNPSWWGKHGQWQWEPLEAKSSPRSSVEQETESRQEIAHPQRLSYLSKQHHQLRTKYTSLWAVGRCLALKPQQMSPLADVTESKMEGKGLITLVSWDTPAPSAPVACLYNVSPMGSHTPCHCMSLQHAETPWSHYLCQWLALLIGILPASLIWLLGVRSQVKRLFERVPQYPPQAKVTFTGYQVEILLWIFV